MTKFFFGAASAVFLCSSAMAEGNRGYVEGQIEYSVENENFTSELGYTMALPQGFVLRPWADFSYDSNVASDIINFDGVNLGVSYAMSPQLSLFSNIEASEKLEYEDAKVGLSFSF
jgi:opacity protein-like surface antigen